MNRSPAIDRAALVVTILFAALVSAPLRAANTWDGGGTDNNWGTAANWDDTLVPTFPVGLTFQGTTRLTSNNEAAGRTVNGITFTGTGANAAGAFTLTGSAITLGGNIVVSGNPATATTQTINLDLILNGNRAVNTAAATSTVVLNGVISGAFNFTKTANNAGTLVLSNTNNSFSGKMVIGGGTTSVASIANSGTNSAIGSGSQIDMGFGATNGGILNFTGSAGGSTNRAIVLTATNTSTQTILNNGANGGSGIVFSGNVTHSATTGFTTTLALGGSNTDANTIQSVLADGASGGTLAVTKSNAGNWWLTGANTFTGNVSVTGGGVSFNYIADSGSSNLGFGSVLSLGGAGSTGLISNNGAGGTTSRTISLADTGTAEGAIFNNGSGALVFTGSFLNSGSAGTKTFRFGGSNTGANEFRGTITNGGNGGVIQVSKQGLGTWLLSGSNTYTGTTTILGGALSAPGFGTAGSASPLGTAATVAISSGANNATLNWTGTTNESTNKTFAIANSTGGVTFANQGSGTLTLLNDLTFSGTGNKTLTLQTASGAATGSIVVAGSISNGANGTVVSVVRSGGAGGKLWLSGTGSTFSGGVQIGANGLLYVPFIGNAGSASPLGTSGTVTLGLGGFQGSLTTTSAADETTNKVFVLNGTGTPFFGSIVSGSTGRLTVTSALATSGSNAKTLQLSTEAAGGGVNFDGLIANGTSTLTVGVRVAGLGGSFRLGNDSNSFTNGVSFVASGGTTTLSVATIGNTGANSALGTSGSITFGSTGGTSLLAYTGAGETSDKTLVVAGAGTVGIAANNASGLLKFTNNMVVTSAAARGFVLDGSGAGEFAGAIVNGASASVTSLTKTGAGTWTLSGVNTYTGTTSVDAGTLFVNGSVAGAVNVANGAVLGGSGSVAGLVSVLAGGTLSPGNSPGELTLGSLALDATSTTLMEINDIVRGTSYDGITITGSNGLTYGGVLSLVFGNGSAFADDTTFDLFSFAGLASGGFSSVTSSGFYAGAWTNNGDGTFKLQKDSQTLTFSQATGDVVVVPEPGALAIAGVGVLLAGWRLRRHRR